MNAGTLFVICCSQINGDGRMIRARSELVNYAKPTWTSQESDINRNRRRKHGAVATHGRMGTRAEHGETVGERCLSTDAGHASNPYSMRLDFALQRQLAGNTRNHVVGVAPRGRVDAYSPVDHGGAYIRVGADLDYGRACGKDPDNDQAGDNLACNARARNTD